MPSSSPDAPGEESDGEASDSDDDSDASSESMSDNGGTDESPEEAAAALSSSSPRTDKAAARRATAPSLSFSRQEDLSTIRSEHISDAARRKIELKSHAMLADPFREHEHDMKKCRALESSLWEVCALQRHYHPKVSRSAHLLLSGGSSSDGKTKSASLAAPYPVAEVCDQSYDSVR